MGFGSGEPIKQSITMVIEPVFGTFGSVGRFQVLLENEINISINLLVDGCVDCGLKKHQRPTPADDATSNHH